MFAIALSIFAVFTAIYSLFTGAIIYHLRQYTLPEHPAPRVVITIFLFLSALFWFFATTFLFKIPA